MRILAIAALLLGLIAPARAAEVVVAGISPYANTGNAEYPGLHLEFLAALAKRTGLDLKPVMVPPPRMAMTLGRGTEGRKPDFAIAFTNPEFDKTGHRLIQLMAFSTIVAGRHGSSFGSLADLRGLSVGVVRSAAGAYSADFNEDPAIERVEINDLSLGLTMLMARRLDAVIGTDVSIGFTARLVGMDPSEFGTPLRLSPFIWWLYARTDGDTKLAEALLAGINSMEADGTTKRLVDRYRGTS